MSKSLIFVSVRVGTAPPIFDAVTCAEIFSVIKTEDKNSSSPDGVLITTTCGFSVASSESPDIKALFPRVEPVLTNKISPL